MNAREFLTAELEHAARQLERVRRLAAELHSRFAAQGLDEIGVYDRLISLKAYRQLLRDEITFQQMWLRVHRQLNRLPAPAQTSVETPAIDKTRAEDRNVVSISDKPVPYRKPPTPGRNEQCSCGSNLKFKRCCGNPLGSPATPLRTTATAAASPQP